MSSTFTPGIRPDNIVARAKAIILTPDREWAVIDVEPASVASLYRNYIMILAAIPPLAHLVRGVLFGYGAFGFVYRPSLLSAIVGAIVSYLFALAGAYVLMLIVDALAPTFQGQKSQVQAMKLVAYAGTASWLAGIFTLIPGLGILSLLGLYSLFLFYKGLPVMMKSPADKALPYTLVIIVSAVVIAVVVGVLSAHLVGPGAQMPRYSDIGGSMSGSVTTPGGGTIQVDKLQQAAAAFEAAAGHAASGTDTPRVPVDTLKSLLPATLADGRQRTAISTAGGQVAGFGGSSAEATYGDDDHQVTLTVADLGAVGALAGLTGALGISGDKEDANSYSRISQQDGRTIAEEYDRQSKHGSYGILVGSRFMVHAEGSPITMDELHAAVESVDVDKLASLVKQ